MNKVTIVDYQWAGTFMIPCKECDMTYAILEDMKGKEFKDLPVEIHYKKWLYHLPYCLIKGMWSPPAIMVNGKKFHQHRKKDPIFDRQKLADHVRNLVS